MSGLGHSSPRLVTHLDCPSTPGRAPVVVATLAGERMRGQTEAVATTVRCPQCQRRNQVPDGDASKARCGACRAPLMPTRGRALESTDRPRPGRPSDTSRPVDGGSPWGSGGPPGAASPWGLGGPGLGGPGGLGATWGGGDPSGARMRQARRTGPTASTSATGRGSARFGASARPTDPRAALLQGWDELLRLVPADMGLTAALGDGADDPISWLSLAADIPRPALDQVRHVRNSLASNRPVPDHVMSSALETLNRALAVVGHTRLPE